MDKSSGGTVTRTVTYYPASGAMRINITGGSNTLYYILKDHLGSASVVTDSTGTIVAEQRYYPYGETRLTSTMLTDKLFTGQREMVVSRLQEIPSAKPVEFAIIKAWTKSRSPSLPGNWPDCAGATTFANWLSLVPSCVRISAPKVMWMCWWNLKRDTHLGWDLLRFRMISPSYWADVKWIL